MNRLSWKRVAEDVYFRCRNMTGSTLIWLAFVGLTIMLDGSRYWTVIVPVYVTFLMIGYRGEITPQPMFYYLPVSRAQRRDYMCRIQAVKVAEIMLLTVVWDAAAYWLQQVPWRNLVIQMVTVLFISGCMLVYDLLDEIELMIKDPVIVVSLLVTVVTCIPGSLIMISQCMEDISDTQFKVMLSIVIAVGLVLVWMARRTWNWLMELLLDYETLQIVGKKRCKS